MNLIASGGMQVTLMLFDVVWLVGVLLAGGKAAGAGNTVTITEPSGVFIMECMIK